ncbi:HNH endonuclease [Rhizorhabdus histidinilytica]|uniref:HNH endonuclease n=1 Tax=Rhizorhabdus histidinilytica TaxID=439228 RepID=UPI001ADD0E79|nr:HNH endonuclease signature motif containing protein [Rhizorhabdus histidinilytica]
MSEDNAPDVAAMLAFAEPADEEWKGTKAQREALRAKFGGRCAYCGGELGKTMHADHREPCVRVTRDPMSRPLPAAEQYMIKPERNTVGNMMPACAPCNIHKGSYPLEYWRAYLQRSADIVRKQTSTFRAAERFGVVTVSADPIIFYFERNHLMEKNDVQG